MPGESGTASASALPAKYKTRGLTQEESRRRREEEGVQLRKQKRDEQLSKRRNIAQSVQSSNQDFDNEFAFEIGEDVSLSSVSATHLDSKLVIS